MMKWIIGISENYFYYNDIEEIDDPSNLSEYNDIPLDVDLKLVYFINIYIYIILNIKINYIYISKFINFCLIYIEHINLMII